MRLRAAVRPAVTLLFAGAITAGFFSGKVSGELYTTLVVTVIAYWFGSRKPAA